MCHILQAWQDRGLEKVRSSSFGQRLWWTLVDATAISWHFVKNGTETTTGDSCPDQMLWKSWQYLVRFTGISLCFTGISFDSPRQTCLSGQQRLVSNHQQREGKGSQQLGVLGVGRVQGAPYLPTGQALEGRGESHGCQDGYSSCKNAVWPKGLKCGILKLV